ncbi:hypothetical protein Q3G72_013419 [Acer saccharum]|nr:hypothetical protein Q3G72_013419 [Acer saccharum]
MVEGLAGVTYAHWGQAVLAWYLKGLDTALDQILDGISFRDTRGLDEEDDDQGIIKDLIIREMCSKSRSDRPFMEHALLSSDQAKADDQFPLLQNEAPQSTNQPSPSTVQAA